jgi:ElaB/YqjD/DUF883 family membrane-anchored ribosome-binding protein
MGIWAGTPGSRCESANLLTVQLLFLKGSFMSNDSPTLVQTQERLVSAIRSEISDAEEMLSATADQAGEKIVRLRSRIENRLREAKFRLIDAEEALIARTREAAHAADNYVHESPWTAIGIAAGVGAVVGLLLGRRL